MMLLTNGLILPKRSVGRHDEALSRLCIISGETFIDFPEARKSLTGKTSSNYCAIVLSMAEICSL